MNVSYLLKKGNLIVKISGEIDHHSSEIIREKLDREYKKQNAKNIIFDFSDIQFMDSSGIGVIMGRYKSTRERGGKIGVYNVNSQIERVFKLSGLYKNKIVNPYHNLEEAILNLQ